MFWRGVCGSTLLGGRLNVLHALPVADKRLAQFVLLSLILGISAARHTEGFANAIHGTVKGELVRKLCRGERNDSISHLGERGLSFRVRSLAFDLVVEAALIFDAEFLALIGNEGIDFECSGFCAMSETLRDLEWLVELDTSNANAAFARWERKGNCRCSLHGRGRVVVDVSERETCARGAGFARVPIE